MVRHKEYFKIDFSKLLMALHEPVLIDGRHLLSDSNGDFSGWQIYSIGKEQ